MSHVLRRAAAPIAQLATTAVLLLGLVARPPRDGAMLLLPLTPGAPARAAAVVTAHGGLIVGQVPALGSLVIRGDHARLAGPLLAQGLLAVASPGAGCGA